jgi:hypothetical protein
MIRSVRYGVRPIHRGRALLACLTLALLLPARVAAQGVVSPTSHWGAVMLPDLQERTEWGLHFIGFTRYGKEVDATGRYTFTPYNDIDRTMGFNLATVSCTRLEAPRLTFKALGCPRFGRTTSGDGRSVGASPFTTRQTIVLGFIDDRIPEWLQNRVIHWSNLKRRKLLPVPRDVADTPDRRPSLARSQYWPPVVGISREYFLRLYYQQFQGGTDVRVPTPFFVGGGFGLGTVNQEGFLHAGANVAENDFRRPVPLFPWWVKLRGISGGAMMRAGVLAPGYYFRDVTAHYVNLQGVGRATIDWANFPTQFEFALTSAHGFFVASRTEAQQEMVEELGPNADPTNVYQAKSALSERFIALRVRIGDFTIETYNDLIGGKDKGPSFGAHFTYNLHRDRRPPPPVTATARPNVLR